MTFRARALAGSAVIMALSGIVSASAQVREPQVTQSQLATPPTMVSVPSANPFPPLDERAREALRRAVRNEQRIDARRDRWRNPEATLQFFGVRPSDSVVEIWPGQGWFTSIIGPYLKQGDGKLIVGHFDAASSNSKVVRQIVDAYRARFAADPAMYGEVNVVPFGPRSVPMAAPNSVDKVLTFRNIHNWMAQGWTEKAFADFYGILKPGGILGIEEHRGRTDEPQDPLARDGYVREDYVIQLATEAGFEFVGGAEINANPADTKDHPFGVWTLPPVSRSSPIGQPDDPGFDRRRYDEIGESDRMTLRFRKPLDATGVSLASLRPTADQIPVTIIPGPPPPPSPRRARRGILPPPPVVEGAQTQSVEAGTAQVVYPGDGGAAAMAAGLRPAAEDPQAKAAAPPRPSPPLADARRRSNTKSRTLAPAPATGTTPSDTASAQQSGDAPRQLVPSGPELKAKPIAGPEPAGIADPTTLQPRQRGTAPQTPKAAAQADVTNPSSPKAKSGPTSARNGEPTPAASPPARLRARTGSTPTPGGEAKPEPDTPASRIKAGEEAPSAANRRTLRKPATEPAKTKTSASKTKSKTKASKAETKRPASSRSKNRPETGAERKKKSTAKASSKNSAKAAPKASPAKKSPGAAKANPDKPDWVVPPKKKN